MWKHKDGWPMLSWYDHLGAWAQNTLVTLGWRIVNVGNWMVRTFHHRNSISSGAT